MKILVFTSQFAVGAAERLGAELAVDLNRNGIRADVMSLYTPDLADSRNAGDELLKRGVSEVHYLGLPPNPSPARILVAIVRLNRILRRKGYDIVETSSLTPGVIAAWGRLRTGARHVAGIHYAFSSAAPAPRSVRLFRLSMRLLPGTRFYAVSAYAKDAWTRFSGLPADRTRVIYNCVFARPSVGEEARDRMRKRLGIPGNSAVLLCAGRLAAYKRQEVVLDAVCREKGRRDFVVLFAGEPDLHVAGTREMVARMEETIARNGLGERVRFLGYRSDLHELMASADLLVHPTEKEAFGMVLAEALESGLPVVSTDVEGIPEVLEGTDSLLIRPGDPAALRRAMDTMLDRSPEEVRRAREKGLARAGRFGQRERTARMIEFFRDVAEGRI